MSGASYSAVFFDGRFVAPDEAKIALSDPGYLLGEGTFATLRGYDGVCFRPARHFAGLARAAALFDMEVPITAARLTEIVDEAAKLTKARDAYVRVTLTKGSDDKKPILSVVSRPMTVPTDDDYSRGIASVILNARRIPPVCLDTTVKTTSYASQTIAKREATKRGVPEGIMLAVDGALASGTMANVFVVRGDRLSTPSFESGCRAGVTREALLELASSVGFHAQEERIERDALFEADEVFFSSTRIECLPIATVDGRALGRGAAEGFPKTAKLRARLREIVRAEAEHR